MMKLAWLCYSSDYNDNTGEDEVRLDTIVFTEPYSRYGLYSRIVPIVYAEITE